MATELPKISKITLNVNGVDKDFIFDYKLYTTKAYCDLLGEYNIKCTDTWLRRLADRGEIKLVEIIKSKDAKNKLRVVENNIDVFERCRKIGSYEDWLGDKEYASPLKNKKK